MKPTYTDYLYLDNVSVIIPSGTGTFDRNTGTYVRNTTFSIGSISIEHTESGTTTVIPISIIDSRIYGSFLVTTNTELEITIRFNTTGVGRFVKFTIINLITGTYTISGIYEYISAGSASIKNIILTKTNTWHTWEECHGLIAAFIDTANAQPMPDVYVYNHYYPSNIDGKNADHYVLRYVKNPGTHSGDFARTPDCIVTSPVGIGLTPPQWDGYIAIPLKMIHLNYKDDYGVEYTDLTNDYYVVGEPIADIQRQIKYKNNIGKIFSTVSNHIYANSSLPIIHLVVPSETSIYVIVYDSAIQKINKEAFYSSNSADRTGEITEIIIPDTTAVIESSAFKDCSSLVSINVIDNNSNITNNTLPNNITLILPHTFLNCKSLEQLIIPNKVEEIQDYAFTGCSNLSTVSLSTTSPYLKGIGQYAFAGTSLLRTISLPNSLTDIGILSFANSGLYNITIPANVKNIGTGAFLSCESLNSATFNLNANGKTSIESIPSGCFASCSAMRNVNSGTNSNTIPEGITNIGTYAFRNTLIENITIPTTLESTGLNLFAGNNRLSSVTWNAINCTGFTSHTISPFFANCDNINNFIFGNSVQRIPSNMCYGMNIETITIPNSVTEIGNAAFKNCTYISTASFVLNNNKVNITTIPLDCFSGDSELVSINTSDGRNNIPEGITHIGTYAFKDTSLTNITIPETLETSDLSIFAGNSVLTSVKWNAINCNNFNSSIAGPFYANKTQIENFTFGNKVKHIPSFLCFYMDNANHTQAIIPSSCEIIDNYAFYFNHKLTYLQLGTSNTSTLTQTDIDVSIKTINEGAFGLCTDVSTCLIPYNVTLIGPLSFLSLGWSTNDGATLYYRAYDTTTVSVYLPNSEIKEFPFYNSRIHKAIFVDGVAFIPHNLLIDAYFVHQIHVSRSVIEIGRNIFNNNDLKTMVFLSGTRILDNRTFNVETYITTNNFKIYFPSSLAYIGASAFENRQNLYEIQLGFGIREINEDAFVNCSNNLVCYCLSIEPPYLYRREANTHNPFDGYGKNNKNLILYIPLTNQNWYKNAKVWNYGPFKDNMRSIPVVTKLNKENNKLYYYLMNRHLYETDNEISREALVTFNTSKYDNPITISGGQLIQVNPSYDINQDLMAVTSTGNFIIPRTIDNNGITYTVTEIGEEAFRGCDNIVNLYLPTSIKYIGPKAFWGCSNLTAIYFYDNDYTTFNDIVLLDSDQSELTTIDRRAFKDCVRLKTMGNTNTFKLPNTVTTIEELSFSCCYSISNIIIGDRLFNIPINAFDRCNGVTNMTISPRNHNYSCDNTRGAVSLYNKYKNRLIKVFDKTIPYTYTVGPNVTIGCQAFTYCRNMKKLKLAVSDWVGISEINGLFYECTSLEEIEWNVKNRTSLLNSYGSPVKKGCFRCTKVEDPITTNTGDYSFIKNYSKSKDNHYPGYTDLNLRYGMNPLRHYNYDTFDYNENIKKFSFGANVERIPDFACYLLNLSNMELSGSFYTITPANNNITEIGNSAFEQCVFKNNNSGGVYYLHCEKVEKILLSAFEQSSIQGIVLGTALSRIGLDAFNSLTSYLSQLYIDYKGTLEQWNSVTKESGWKFGTTVYLKTNDTEWHKI